MRSTKPESNGVVAVGLAISTGFATNAHASHSERRDLNQQFQSRSADRGSRSTARAIKTPEASRRR